MDPPVEISKPLRGKKALSQHCDWINWLQRQEVALPSVSTAASHTLQTLARPMSCDASTTASSLAIPLPGKTHFTTTGRGLPAQL